MTTIHKCKDDNELWHGLTPLQVETMKMYATGYSPREISEKRRWNERCVYFRITAIKKKLRLETYADVVAYALKYRLITRTICVQFQEASLDAETLP